MIRVVSNQEKILKDNVVSFLRYCYNLFPINFNAKLLLRSEIEQKKTNE